MNEEETKEDVEETKVATLDPHAFKKFFAKVTSKASEGNFSPSMRARMAWVTLFPEMCRPDTFDGPIELGMREIDSATERRVQLSIAASAPRPGEAIEERDPSMVGAAFSIALAKAAIVEINGYQLQPHEIDVIWEAIGMAGRQLCGETFTLHCCGMDEESQKKARALVRIG